MFNNFNTGVSYLCFAEDLSRYCAKLEGHNKISLRHRIKAGFLAVSFLMLTPVVNEIIKKLPFLEKINIIVEHSLFFEIVFFILIMGISVVLLYFLSKIINIYTWTIITLIIFSAWFYVVGFYDMVF